MPQDEDEKSEAIVVGGARALNRFQPTPRSVVPARSGPLTPKSATAEAQYQALRVERRNNFIDDDPLVKVVNHGGDAFAVLREIKREIAREAASLHFDRLEAESGRAKDPTTISARRIEALRRIADIELKIRELDQHSINLSSEKMQRVFALWVEVIKEVAQEVMTPEVMELFFNRFATAMEGWEERAQDALR